jgi:hypothetical protein
MSLKGGLWLYSQNDSKAGVVATVHSEVDNNNLSACSHLQEFSQLLNPPSFRC